MGRPPCAILGAVRTETFNPAQHPRRSDGKFKRSPAPELPSSAALMMLAERPAEQAGGIGDPLTSEQEADLCTQLLAAIDGQDRTLNDALEEVVVVGGNKAADHFERACRSLYGDSGQEGDSLISEMTAEGAAAKIREAASQMATGSQPLQAAIIERCVDSLCDAAEERSGELRRSDGHFDIVLTAWRFVCDNAYVRHEMFSELSEHDDPSRLSTAFASRRDRATTRATSEPW